MGVILKSDRQIEGLRSAGRLVAETYQMLQPFVVPGVSTHDLDRIAEEFILANGASPVYKGYSPPDTERLGSAPRFQRQSV